MKKCELYLCFFSKDVLTKLLDDMIVKGCSHL